MEEEFWIGNDNLFLLTGEDPVKVRFDLWNKDDQLKYAEYKEFSVSDENHHYRLKISSHSGTCANEMNYHNGMKFSTKDRDNDEWSSDSCSEE